MIKIGEYNELTILRDTSVGFYLGDEDEDVLLPNKYCPQEYEVEGLMNVFVYRDGKGRKVATTLTPKVLLNEFAFLEVTHVSEVGAFVYWGMEKDLFVPFREQKDKMEEGKWYVIYLFLDEQTDRLVASNQVEKFLDNQELTVKEGDEVSLMVLRKTEIGYTVAVNHKHAGLVFKNEVFKPIKVGSRMKGYVKTVRDDGKLDISLQPIGYQKFNDVNTETLFRKMERSGGVLKLTDKSSPDEIYQSLGMSKKAFKRALGALYKDRKVELLDDRIKLL